MRRTLEKDVGGLSLYEASEAMSASPLRGVSDLYTQPLRETFIFLSSLRLLDTIVFPSLKNKFSISGQTISCPLPSEWFHLRTGYPTASRASQFLLIRLLLLSMKVPKKEGAVVKEGRGRRRKTGRREGRRTSSAQGATFL